MTVDEVAARRRRQTAAAERAEQVARQAGRRTWIAMVSAAVLAALIGAAVASAVVGDARAARAATGRAELDAANDRLVALRVPVVADPGPDASGDELVIAAAVARTRGDIVSGVVRVPAVLPLPPAVSDRSGDTNDDSDSSDSSTSGGARSDGGAPAPAGGAPGGPSLVVVPGPAGQPARAVPVGPAPAAPAPAPAPAPRRGVLEPCLLGSILC